jgi:hypothetical protein
MYSVRTEVLLDGHTHILWSGEFVACGGNEWMDRWIDSSEECGW